VPFVAKATGVSLAQAAVRVMMGHSLARLRDEGVIPAATPQPSYVSVKEAVLPFSRFPGVDTLLGPEMRSTGEVMASVRVSASPSPSRNWRPARAFRQRPDLHVARGP